MSANNQLTSRPCVYPPSARPHFLAVTTPGRRAPTPANGRRAAQRPIGDPDGFIIFAAAVRPAPDGGGVYTNGIKIRPEISQAS